MLVEILIDLGSLLVVLAILLALVIGCERTFL